MKWMFRGMVLATGATGILCLLGMRPAHSAEPEKRRPHFVDIAAKSSFTYKTDNDFSHRKYFPQPMCGGSRHPRLRQRWPDGYLLHQRRQTAGTEEDRSAPSTIACCTTEATAPLKRIRPRGRPAR